MAEFMKGNKIIAEFMELETEIFSDNNTTRGEYSKQELNYYYHGTLDRIIDQGWFEAHELSYNLSWDWLMPVVVKIEQDCEGVPQEMLNVSLYSDIDEVYNAVVEYIIATR
tara:strand:+ start:145 stop:477 length:333 start_codon:yes stop_codon:yes gene_type:complete